MKTLAAFVAALVLLAGCDTMKGMWNDLTLSGPKAVAVLEPTQGSNVRGTINFKEHGNRVNVSGTVSGLRPNSQVGFHIHEAGDCSSGDGMSAKGHFNPQGKPHGSPDNPERHAGDMPMLKADARGNASFDADLDIMSVEPGPNSVVNRAVIVHVQSDDYRTQPTGNAGARAACGVIRKS
ncbi:MAG TPA: superoxide dismutase family protein [Burkholderiales bacterium]|nr:superoxide dismutase family protein [Burkholderiales bacterium]